MEAASSEVAQATLSQTRRIGLLGIAELVGGVTLWKYQAQFDGAIITANGILTMAAYAKDTLELRRISQLDSSENI